MVRDLNWILGRRREWIVCILLLAALGIGCGKKDNGRTTLVAAGGNTVSSIHSNRSSQVGTGSVIEELWAMESPEGVDEEDFQELRETLERELKGRETEKIRSNPRSPDSEEKIKIAVSLTGFSWKEARAGDWDNDGVVTLQDIVPLAFNFGRSTDPNNSNYYKYAEYIDGNGDGIVGAGDVSAIAFHFGESTGGYSIYEADDSSGTGRIKVAEIKRPPVPSDPENPPTDLSFETLRYDTLTGDISPPGWAPTHGKWYQVVPYDRSEPPEESTDVASEFAQFNLPPSVVFYVYPSKGTSPLSAELYSYGSSDPDGEIVLYEWDFTSDGQYDEVSVSNYIYHLYSTPGTYTATLRITDNDGATATASTQVEVLDWRIDVVDSEGDVGNYPSLAYDPDGNPAISYFDITKAELKLARWNGASWDIEVVEGNLFFPLSGAPAAASLGNEEVLSVHPIDLGLSTAKPREFLSLISPVASPYLPWDLEKTIKQIGPGAPPPASILAYDKDGNPSICYKDIALELKLATWNPTTSSWDIEIIDSPAGFPDLAYNPDGNPCVSYINLDSRELVFARKAGGSWEKQSVFAVEVTWPWTETSLAFDGSGNPYISFWWFPYQQIGMLLLASSSDGGVDWEFNVLDSGVGPGYFTSLAFRPDGSGWGIAYTYYLEAGGYWSLRYISSDRAGTPLQLSNSGMYLSLAFSPDGNPSVAHFNSRDIAVARFDGFSWDYIVIQEPAVTGSYSSLAFDTRGLPGIAYFVQENGDLAFATPQSSRQLQGQE